MSGFALVGLQVRLAGVSGNIARNNVSTMHYLLQHPEKHSQVPAVGAERDSPEGEEEEEDELVREIRETEEALERARERERMCLVSDPGDSQATKMKCDRLPDVRPAFLNH